MVAEGSVTWMAPTGERASQGWWSKTTKGSSFCEDQQLRSKVSDNWLGVEGVDVFSILSFSS